MTWFSIIATLVLCGQISRAEVVSTGVGIVKTYVVTSRQVQIQNLLETAMYDKAPAGKLKTMALDSKEFSKAVSSTLLEWVIALEAQNFSLVHLQADELKKAESHVAKVLGKVGDWRELEVTSRELNEALERKLKAKQLTQFRAQSSVLPITDVEAQRYFEENRLKFGNLPFANFKENIKSFLSRTQVDKRLKDWFEVLLAKYKVKNLIAVT